MSLTVRSYSEHPSFRGQWIPSPLALPDKLNTCWWHKHTEQFWTPLSGHATVECTGVDGEALTLHTVYKKPHENIKLSQWQHYIPIRLMVMNTHGLWILMVSQWAILFIPGVCISTVTHIHTALQWSFLTSQLLLVLYLCSCHMCVILVLGVCIFEVLLY